MSVGKGAADSACFNPGELVIEINPVESGYLRIQLNCYNITAVHAIWRLSSSGHLENKS